MREKLERLNILKYYTKFQNQYIETVKKYHVEYSNFLRLKVFVQWYKSLLSKKSTLEMQQPWIVLFSIPFLKKEITPNSLVFEYGSGGSTLFFAKKAKQVISVEHDIVWFEKISSAIKQLSNVEVILSPPLKDDIKITDPSDSNSYISSAPIFNGYSFFNYASVIDKYPDAHFDFILIDGRARPSCLKHAAPKIKKGGYIILDDADREYYFANTKQLIKDFSPIDFPGPVLGLEPFYRTLILKRN